MKNISIDTLIHQLEVFLRENPEWADAEVLFMADFVILRKDKEYKTIDCRKA